MPPSAFFGGYSPMIAGTLPLLEPGGKITIRDTIKLPYFKIGFRKVA
jgi:hypothetical protein